MDPALLTSFLLLGPDLLPSGDDLAAGLEGGSAGPVSDLSDGLPNSTAVNALAIIKAILVDSDLEGSVGSSTPVGSGVAVGPHDGSLTPAGLFLNADGGLPGGPLDAPAGCPLAAGLREGTEQPVGSTDPSGVTQKSPTGRRFGTDPREVVTDTADADPLGSSSPFQVPSDEKGLFATVPSRAMGGPESAPPPGPPIAPVGTGNPAGSLLRVAPEANGGGPRNSSREPSEANRPDAGPDEEAAGADGDPPCDLPALPA